MTEQKFTFKNVQQGSVVESIVAVFKEKMMLGELQLGERLPTENQLMLQLGVGRSALREAIRMMSACGVIEVRQGEGMYVVNEPTSSILDPLIFAVLLKTGVNENLLELRQMLEIAYCQLAAEKMDEQDLIQIKQAADHFEALIHANESLDAMTQADLEFHYEIIKATHNPLVVKICKTVEELFFVSIRKTISDSEGQEWGVEGHRRMLEAIYLKDYQNIRLAVRQSLKRWSMEITNETNAAQSAPDLYTQSVP